MNKHVLFMAVTILILAGTGIVSQAYAAFTITMETDKDVYDHSSVITVTGQAEPVDPQGSDVSIQIFAPNGNLATVAQVTPSSDGNYSTTFKAGGMINAEGDYTVKAKWGAQSNQTTFKYGGSSGAPVVEEEVPEPTQTEVVDEEPEVDEEPVMESSQPVCGPGTVLKNNVCVAEQQKGGGCLIATAAFGSEMAPQVQFLREIRDGTVLQTQSGSTFMTGFNQFYYSFSPAIADYERENPAFKETVKIAITPMLTSLAILNYVDIDSESEMLGYGIGIILLNIGMYFVAPAVIIFKIRNRK